MNSPSTSEVFGVSRLPILSYIERPDVDERFKTALDSDKQIIVYGSSKQGKTALVSRHLSYDENSVVSITPKMKVADIYSSILRKNGIRIERGGSQTRTLEGKAGGGMKFSALIPFLGKGETEVKTELRGEKSDTNNFKEIPFNLEIPQDICDLLEEVNSMKVVILENFHYLNDEEQKALAFDLRAFQELGLQFVILGVWREKNRLVQYNGDLMDRIIEIPVEPWSKDEFHQVAKKGAEKLNIKFSPRYISSVIGASFASIGVFQEILKESCLDAGINARQKNVVEVKRTTHITKAIRKKAVDYSSRHQRALEAIAVGNVSLSSQGNIKPLFLHYYLVKVILQDGYEGLKNGMSRVIITEKIQATHHRGGDVRASDMSSLLYKLGKTQSNKGISPPIIDYDQGSKLLQVVDSTFYFFLKHADLETIAEELQNPLE